MSVLNNLERRAETAWMAVLNANADIVASGATIRRWRTNAAPAYPCILVHCTTIQCPEFLQNVPLAERAVMEIAAETLVREDGDRETLHTLVGAIRDTVSDTNIIAALSATTNFTCTSVRIVDSFDSDEDPRIHHLSVQIEMGCTAADI